jgi:hypothetical protein
MYERPEKIRFTDTVRSIIDLGKVAVAEVLSKIDTHFADAINDKEEES